MFDLTSAIYQDAAAARAYLESIHWPEGPTCPHCGNAESGTMPLVAGEKHSHRNGLHYCNACKGQFTVTVGTVFERSKIALNKWVLASHLMAASKKGISAHQLHRMLGVTYKTAWFMAHRLREAMKETAATHGPIGGEGKTVEMDETYIGRKDDQSPSSQRNGKPYLKRKTGNLKRTVIALVERGGSVRSFHVENATRAAVEGIVATNADLESTFYTDESRIYPNVAATFAASGTVHHSSGEYARFEDEKVIHTNTIENVFSVFKRGMHGTYQHCGEAHLHRYLAEFDFRYNRRTKLGFSDDQRTLELLAGARGKRLTYRRTSGAAFA
jgi:transposase-like protein